MQKKSMKLVVSLLAGITLGSSVIGSGLSIANASENNSIVQLINKDMSKYSTTTYDAKTDSTIISVSSDQFVRYLIDSGVKPEDIPSDLKVRSSFKIFHIKFYGRKSHGNANLYVTERGMRLYHGSAMAGHLYLMIIDLYGDKYGKAVKNFAGAVKDVVEAASTRYGRVFYMRHWHYEGSHRWH